uniref:G-protein coupled receptors family 1 profile domain-containing protein n=1 Tax=Erpetoichthys calabaricus TaxID=27687 RepID=A0A8C4T0R1_ERPCA
MGLKEAERVFCPHPENTTCSLQNPSLAVSIILYIIFITAILLATFGNLVVIISIAHFKQLHTPTNVLTLSMAVADFIIGVFVMPFRLIQIMDKCWDLDVHTCMAGIFCFTVVTTISVTHLIFLSVDRYYAVCYPLHYSTKITVGRAWVFAAICWICSICYNVLFFYVEFTFLLSEKNVCLGFCLFVTLLTLLIVDMLFNSILPFSVMLVFYSKILIVAIQHAKALRNIRNEAQTVQKKKQKKGFRKKQNKATITIGIVIGTFFLFISQFQIFAFLSLFITVSKLALGISEYLLLLNFALNPLIYGLFYPWFRKGFKCIITCTAEKRQGGQSSSG